MVFRANFANRFDTENTPPSILGPKQISRPHHSLHDAARRRRARTNGLASTKHAVEHAKRKQSKSPHGSLRFKVTTVAPPPVADVEMRDTEPSGSSTISTAPVSLPKTLGHPEFFEVTKEAIEAVDPNLADIEVEFLRDVLPEFSSK